MIRLVNCDGINDNADDDDNVDGVGDDDDDIKRD